MEVSAVQRCNIFFEGTGGAAAPTENFIEKERLKQYCYKKILQKGNQEWCTQETQKETKKIKQKQVIRSSLMLATID